MNEQEAQLVEKLADQRRDEITKLTNDNCEANENSGSALELTEEQLDQWQHGRPGEVILVDDPQKELQKPLFPAMQDKVPLNSRPKHLSDGGSTPEQYGLPAGARELQDLIEHRDMNFAVGNIFKACYRMGNCGHSSARRDLNKMIWFAKRELARL